jgi:hypothetical protein
MFGLSAQPMAADLDGPGTKPAGCRVSYVAAVDSGPLM